MLVPLRSLRSPILLALLALPLLAACGKHGDEAASSADNSQADAAKQAQEEAASTAKCADNPLAQALPPKDTIGGLPFRSWDCTPSSIRAVYGKNGGKQVEISVSDTRPADTGTPAGAEDVNRRTRDMQRSVTRQAIELLTSMTDPMQASAQSFDALGGPAYAPVLVPTATPDAFVIHVTAQSQVGPAEAVALFKDRHVVTLQSTDHGSALTGLNTPQAQALYLPFLQQFHPERLPQ
jgi:predicted small lipoprotein YifL